MKVINDGLFIFLYSIHVYNLHTKLHREGEIRGCGHVNEKEMNCPCVGCEVVLLSCSTI